MEEINLKEVYSYLKTKILWILLAVIVIVVIGNIYTILTRTPMYQSNTTIVLVGESKKRIQSNRLCIKSKFNKYL